MFARLVLSRAALAVHRCNRILIAVDLKGLFIIIPIADGTAQAREAPSCDQQDHGIETRPKHTSRGLIHDKQATKRAGLDAEMKQLRGRS